MVLVIIGLCMMHFTFQEEKDRLHNTLVLRVTFAVFNEFSDSSHISLRPVHIQTEHSF
jgi:hypothetical protein